MPADIGNSKKEGLEKLQNLKNTTDAIESLNDSTGLGTLMNSVDSTDSDNSNMLDYFLDLLQITGGPDVVKKLRSKTAKLTEPLADECREIIFEELIQFLNCNLDFVIPSADGLVNGNPTTDSNMMTFKVKSLDPFKMLKTDPSSKVGKAMYEKLPPALGQLPYSTNHQLYERLQNAFLPIDYFGASGQRLFTIEFDGNETYNVRPVGLDNTFQDNYLLTGNDRKITTFLRDYFDSIKIFEGQNFLGNLLDALSGFLDVQLNLSGEEVELKGKFGEMIQKILGLCGDDGDGATEAPITTSGIGHISEDGGISLEPNSPFWDFGPQELRHLETETNLKMNGLIKFITCEDIEGKINVDELNNQILSIINENNPIVEGVKIDSAIQNTINGMSTTDSGLGFKLPQLQVEFDLNILKKLPQILVSLILTPKILLGIAIALKAVGQFFETNDIMELLKKLSKLIVKIVKRIFKVIIELIWEEIKKMIIKLVKTILQEILNEKQKKQLAIINSLIQTLLAAVDIIDNLSDCRSILDTLLKYLKIPPVPSIDVPKNLLFASASRPGFSDVRAFQNVLENLQKAGINTEPHADGSTNATVVTLFNSIKGVEKERTENSVVKVATYAQNVQTSGGPGVTETGTGTGVIV
jgi:hypothetical protein